MRKEKKMQDRFKFRVWCKTHKEWEKDEVLISNKNCYVIQNDKFVKRTDFEAKNHIINFCTGLKDNTKWSNLSLKEKQDFYNQVRSEDGKTIKYEKIEDVEHLWKGKLIFEGDILKVNTGSRDTSGYGVVEYAQHGCNFVVNGFLENPSGFYPRRKGEFFLPLQEWLCTKIIGNIYENPELLEETNDKI